MAAPLDVKARRARAAKPSPGRDGSCDKCGRAHPVYESCPEPRVYHDAPFLKKYGG